MPITVLPLLFVFPIPNLMSGYFGNDASFLEPSGSGYELALFFTSIFATSALVLPIFLWHVEIIPLKSMFYALGGTFAIFMVVVLYQVIFNAEEESPF